MQDRVGILSLLVNPEHSVIDFKYYIYLNYIL